MKKSFLRKIFTFISVFSIVAQSLTPYAVLLPQQASAQEVTDQTTVDQVTPPQETPTPTVAQDQTTPTETVTPTPTDVPTGEITPTPTEDPALVTPVQENNNSPPAENQNPTDNSNSSNNNPETPTVTPEVSVTPKPQPETGNEELNLIILNDVSAPSIDLEAVESQGSAVLTTDKPDYAPTDTALITGSNLLPNTTYTLRVWSDDEPPTGVSAQVTSDDKGVFAYAYQLDGTYRPNYSAELKDSAGNVVASTTFTDADTTFLAPTASASNGSGDDWANPNNAFANGSGVAEETNQERERYLNFGFSVPAGATINGVEVKADAFSTDSSGCQLGVDLSWNGGLNFSTEKTSNLTNSETTFTLGGIADTWGRTWSSTEFSNANFVVRVHDVDPGSNCNSSHTTSLDFIQARVTYTPAAQPDLTAVKSHTPAGNATNGVPFTWTIHVANAGNATASFTNGQTILTDNLPSSGATYGSPSVTNPVGVGGTGSISCPAISSSNLNCTASGGTGVTLAAGSSFDISFTVTPTSAGSLVNPRSGSGSPKCQVDPNNVVTESSETTQSNNCSETVTVNATQPDLTAVKSNNVNNATTVNQAFMWKIHVANGGTAAATYSSGNTIVSDHLPSSGATYGSPTASAISGGSGTVTCSINGSFNLTCTASSTVTINAGGSFDITWTTTPTATGTLANPRDGTCSVSTVTGESTTTNNSCSNSVTVIRYVAPNPDLPRSCGLDIALVIDNSDSISTSELNQMKAAMNGFITALTGTPTQYSVTRFATTANVVQNFPGATASTAINGISQGGGFTNWQDGFTKASSTLTNRADHPDLVIFASDGNPNRTGTSGTTVAESVAVDNAVVVANALKTSGARVIALGIGDNLNVDNLKAISGPTTVGTSVSLDVITSSFDTLAADLETYAKAICGGTITVYKLVDGVPQAGWNFSANVNGGSAQPTSGQTVTDGTVQFTITPTNETASVDITESQDHQGYVISSATCVKNNQSVGTFDNHDSVMDITIGNSDIVSCTFNNHLVPTTGSLTVCKYNDVDGNGTPDSPLQWNLTITKQDAPNQNEVWSTTTNPQTGCATLSGMPFGNYLISEDQVSGWQQTYPHNNGTWGDQWLEINAQTLNPSTQFYNHQVGHITVEKILYQPGDSEVLATNDNTLFNFSMTGQSNFNLSNGQNQTFEVTPGEYTVSENTGNTSDNYDLLGCTANYGDGGQGIPAPNGKTVTVGAGDSVTVTCENQQRTGTITGYKWNDLTPNGIRDCEPFDLGDQTRQICENFTEPTLSGWTIFIDENGDGQLNGEEQSTTTDNNGNYSFENLKPGPYIVCEVNKPGWNQTYPNFGSQLPTCHQITVGSGDAEEGKNFGNHNLIPTLELQKTNNSSGNKAPGDIVEYTLTLEVKDANAENVKVIDLLPKGFHYNAGSYQVFVNDVEQTGSFSEPTYASPGTWTLNNLSIGDVVRMVYKATIDGGQQTGDYSDLAWANGNSESSVNVLATAGTNGNIGNPNFVGTQVSVLNGDLAKADYKSTTTQEVLGASTYLPATGENTLFVIIATLMLALGLGTVVGGIKLRRKYE